MHCYSFSTNTNQVLVQIWFNFLRDDFLFSSLLANSLLANPASCNASANTLVRIYFFSCNGTFLSQNQLFAVKENKELARF